MSLDSEQAQRLVNAVENATDLDVAISAAEAAFAFLIGQLHVLGDEANGYPRNPIVGRVWKEGQQLTLACDRFADAVARWKQHRGEEQATGLATAMALQVMGHYPDEIFPRVLRNARCRESLQMTEGSIEGYSCIVDDFKKLDLENELDGAEDIGTSQARVVNSVRDALRALERLDPARFSDEDKELCARLDRFLGVFGTRHD